ncbi:MFS transporter [Curtobacterium sp. MCSS17_008]|uniref:MFS transporter n=1 Tax=Curtobacterium sp. MCSS17_008 TaxID=2175647 RepID=UPI000DA71802|nr:MFS transporter [Curtobacterium sp. MCSS17_008]PZF57848.1 MFS transporter [Curtobacterium sp. MCSS17_008]
MSSTRTTPPTATEAVATQKAGRVPHRWRNLVTITGAEVVDNTEAGLLSTLFPSIAAALKLDNGHLGLLSALGKFATIPLGPFWVWIADRFGRKQALVANNIVGAILGIMAGTSQDFVQLLIWNTLLAGVVACGQPITNSVIADSFDDRSRAKATGVYYGILTAVSSFIGPLLALFTGTEDGWRYGMWVIGGICFLSSFLITAFYVDPGVGASERQLADLDQAKRSNRVTVAGVVSLFKVPTFSIMMLSRLLSGHLLITVFGIQFLVTERGFDNAVAATVLIPFGLGYVLVTFASGLAVAWLDKVWPFRGRVTFNMAAQLLFGLAAFFGTQFDYDNIGIYMVFWALFGAFQGMNPPVNRPILMSVVLPELRGQAFAIFLTFFQTIGWAVFSLTAGYLADQLGIEGVFFWVLFVLMMVNGLVLAALYVTYPKDVRRVTEELDARRAVAKGRA